MQRIVLPLLILAFCALPPTFAGAESPQVLGIPILMYHHVGNPKATKAYGVDQAMFEWQMDALAAQGFQTVSLDEIAAALRGAGSLPPKPIAITFDDGWAHQVRNTLSVLSKHGFKATYFLIAGLVGTSTDYLDWKDAARLVDAGMWIGSHAMTHRLLTKLSDAELSKELSGSRLILEERLGVKVSTLAYPGGDYDARVQQAARDAGYSAAAAVLQGYTQKAAGLYRLMRVGVYGIDTRERFEAKIDMTFFDRSWP
jgi:peptidoglycan/xylan/chitin deacetylase (PgdA/CDA1 family)